MSADLNKHVAEHESFGARRCDRTLGIHKMPDGYALMLDADEMYFYWLAYDGRYSSEHWNKWAVYRSAKQHAQVRRPPEKTDQDKWIDILQYYNPDQGA